MPCSRSHATCGTAVVPQSDGDKHGGFVLLDAALDAVLTEAIALFDAKREEGLRIGAEAAEDAPEQRGRGDAVDIVVAEDDDFLACGDGLEDALGAALEVGSGETDR